MHKQRIFVSLILVFSLLATLVPIEDLGAQPLATPIPETPKEEPATPVPTGTVPTQSETPAAEIPAGTPASESATPDSDASRGMLGPAQVANGSMHNCSQSSSRIPPGGSVSVTCDLTISVITLGNPIAQVTRPTLTGGYTASINMVHGDRSASLSAGATSSAVSLAMGLTAVGGSRTARVTIIINAPNAGASTGNFSARFNACRGAATGGCFSIAPQNGWVDISLTVEDSSLVDGVHYRASCTAPDNSSVAFGQYAISTCQVTALDALGTSKIMLNDLVTTLNGAAGWSGLLVNIDGEPTATGTVPGLHRVDPAPILGRGQSFSWEIWLEPTSCSAADAPLTLGVRGNITRLDSNGQNPGTTITTSPRLIEVSFVPPTTASASAIITEQPAPVSVPYSMTDERFGTTSITAQYTVSGCDPWNGYVQMSPFSPVVGTPVSTVPELESASHGEITLSGPGFTELWFGNVDTIGSSLTNVIGGTEPGREVQINHRIYLDYIIPPNTPAGTYTSTITVTTSDAP